MKLKQITIPVEEKEYNLISETAKNSGMSRAGFVRFNILKLISQSNKSGEINAIAN